jgi:hypothetical protein
MSEQNTESTKVWVKTEDGWREGTVYIKTEDGWRVADGVLPKTEDGWRDK